MDNLPKNSEALLNFVDSKDPEWFYAWCAREGSWDELTVHAEQLSEKGAK